MSRAKATWQSGMTLVELLVALAIFGLLALLLSGGLQFGARTWEATSTALEKGARVRAVQAFLRNTFAQSRPVRQSTARSDPRRTAKIVFAGQRDRVDFVAILPAHLATGGLSKITIKKGSHDGKDALVMEWRPFDNGFSEPGSAGETVTATLLDGVDQLSFSYLLENTSGNANSQPKPQWVDEVRGVDQLPLLVRLNVVRSAARAGFWPELTLELPTRYPGRRRPTR